MPRIMTTNGKKFATAINCIDGRTQDAINTWIKKEFNADYVDMITEPGVDGIIARSVVHKLSDLREKARISYEGHGSRVAIIAGHFDCLGNPVSKEEHIIHIKKACKEIAGWGMFPEIAGIWVNEDWKIEEVVRGL